MKQIPPYATSISYVYVHVADPNISSLRRLGEEEEQEEGEEQKRAESVNTLCIHIVGAEKEADLINTFTVRVLFNLLKFEFFWL